MDNFCAEQWCSGRLPRSARRKPSLPPVLVAAAARPGARRSAGTVGAAPRPVCVVSAGAADTDRAAAFAGSTGRPAWVISTSPAACSRRAASRAVSMSARQPSSSPPYTARAASEGQIVAVGARRSSSSRMARSKRRSVCRSMSVTLPVSRGRGRDPPALRSKAWWCTGSGRGPRASGPGGTPARPSAFRYHWDAGRTTGRCRRTWPFPHDPLAGMTTRTKLALATAVTAALVFGAPSPPLPRPPRRRSRPRHR